MTHNTKRGLILPALILFALVVFGVVYLCHRIYRTHPPTQSQVEALNDALKNGLISKPQYDSELKKLNDKSQPNPQLPPSQSTP
jgi:hypothetical protein